MTRWLLALLFAFGSVTFLTGCPAEEGSDADDAMNAVEEGAENAGDAIEEGAENAGDAIEDATD